MSVDEEFTLDVLLPDDEIDKWMRDELERARDEFAQRLEILVEQYAQKKFGALGKHISRNIVIKVGMEMT